MTIYLLGSGPMNKRLDDTRIRYTGHNDKGFAFMHTADFIPKRLRQNIVDNFGRRDTAYYNCTFASDKCAGFRFDIYNIFPEN